MKPGTPTCCQAELFAAGRVAKRAKVLAPSRRVIQTGLLR